MYIDAGTGSMLLQAGAAVFFTVVVYFRQILNWFRNLGTREGQQDTQTTI